MSNKYNTSDGEEEFVVVDYKDCSINEEKFDSTSITSNNTMKNEKRDINMTDEVNSLKTKSDTCFTTMDDKNRNSSEESLPYDEMMEKAEEVVNSILKNIPDEYVPKSDGKEFNDVIEEDGESKHQENDEYSILSVNNINNNQNEEETEDIFVSDPKPTTTHYVSESTIPNTASALPAFENFVEHISDNIIDTSTDIVNKITDQTKEPFQNILDNHENNMTNLETTNYMFEDEKPAENSRFYDELSNDNFAFPKSSHDMFNDGIEELKKTEEAVDEGFSNALFGTNQLLQKSNDFFTNEIPINTDTVISSQSEETKDISEPKLNESGDFHTFENDLKEEEEIRNDNDMLDFSSVDDHGNNDSGDTSPTKNFFEEEITHQQNVLLSSNDEPTTPEGKVSDDINDFEYTQTTPDNYSMTYNNHEYKNEELKEQSNEEDEAFRKYNLICFV
uniref:PAM2 domain-containing protein n=1 Tax=Strongyloides papillosus TaxID=174720 RepID=A0A0N5BDX6_STREA